MGKENGLGDAQKAVFWELTAFITSDGSNGEQKAITFPKKVGDKTII